MTQPTENRPPLSLRPGAGMALLLLVIPALIFLDYRAGPGFSLRLFYLIPTALAAWTLRMAPGIAVALVSAGFCVFVDVNVRPHVTGPFGVAWEGASNFAVFALFAIMVSMLRGFLDESIANAPLDRETGLASRRAFDRALEAEASRSRRYRRPLALVLIDTSAPKGRKGTAVVAAIGRAVRSHVREGDIVARVGDRRVGVVLLECPSRLASQALERIRAQLFEAMGERLAANGVGIGLVCYGGTTAADAGTLMGLGDAQASASRREGKVAVAETTVA